jgi:hypothetical protein
MLLLTKMLFVGQKKLQNDPLLKEAQESIELLVDQTITL